MLLRRSVLRCVLASCCWLLALAAHGRAAAAEVLDDDQLRAAAEIPVNAATTPVDKFTALYERSRLPTKLYVAEPADWLKGLADIDEALRLIEVYQTSGAGFAQSKSSYYFQRGFLLSRLRRYPEAIGAYDDAVRVGFENEHHDSANHGGEALGNRALIKSVVHDFAGALADFDRAIKFFSNPTWLQGRAQCHYQLGDYAAAVADWTRAEAGKPSPEPCPFDESQAPLNQAVAEHPGEAAPLVARARYIFARENAGAPELGDSYLGKNATQRLTGRRPAPKEKGYDFDQPERRARIERAEKYSDTLEDLDRAVAAEPDSVEALLERGRVRAAYVSIIGDSGSPYFDFNDTPADLDKAVQLEPGNAEAWYELGIARLVLWDFETQTMAFLIKPEAEQTARRSASLQGAIRAFSRAIQAAPETSGLAHLQRFHAVQELKQFVDRHQLLVDFTASIEQNLSPTDAEWDHRLHPRDPGARRAVPLAELHFFRGLLLANQGKITPALADFDQVVALQPDAFAAHLERGKILVRRGDYAAALTSLDLVVEKLPGAPDGWTFRAVAHDAQGDVEAARSDLARAGALDPKLTARLTGTRYDPVSPNPGRGITPRPVTTDTPVVPPGTALEHKNAGNALVGKKDAAGALNEYNLALTIDPAFADALNNRAMFYSDHGLADLALADLDHAIASDPKHRAAYFSRGLLWRELGDPERELADFNHALEFADNDSRRASVLRARGRTRQNARDLDGAMADVQAALQLNPNDAGAWTELGWLQANREAMSAAAGSFRHAVDLESKDPITHANLALALALLNDDSAGTELDTALEWAQDADKFAEIRAMLVRALKKRPGAATVQALIARLDAAEAKRTEIKV